MNPNTIYEKRFDTGTLAELSEDFTLPDYQAEVRRILGVRAQAVIDGKYLHQAGVAGVDLEGDWHEDRDVGQHGIRKGAELHRRLNAGGLRVWIEADDIAGQGAMQGMEDFLLQRFTFFMGHGVVHMFCSPFRFELLR